MPKSRLVWDGYEGILSIQKELKEHPNNTNVWNDEYVSQKTDLKKLSGLLEEVLKSE